MKTKSLQKLRVKKHIGHPILDENAVTIYYQDAGSGTYDDFVQVVNGKRYKYRRARIWLEDSKGVKVRKPFYARTDAELNKKIKAAKAKPASAIDPEKTTLGEYFDWWISTSGKLRAKTVKDYKFNFDRHIRRRIGKAKLAKLSPENFRALFKELDEDKVGARTRELSYQVLHAALNRLVKDGSLTRNPLTSVDKPKAPKADIRIPTLEEAQKLLKAARGTRGYPLILIATLTGMRQGELFGLQWSNVHLDQGWLWVCHSLTKDAEGKLKLDKPKNEASIRRVDLDARQLSALAKHRKEHPGSGFVFTASEGGPIWADTFRARVWEPLLEKAKLPHLSFNSLRHFGNSILAQQGYNLKVLQARLGHASMDMTASTYMHLLPGATKQAAEALANTVLATGLNGAKARAKKGLSKR